MSQWLKPGELVEHATGPRLPILCFQSFDLNISALKERCEVERYLVQIPGLDNSRKAWEEKKIPTYSLIALTCDILVFNKVNGKKFFIFGIQELD